MNQAYKRRLSPALRGALLLVIPLFALLWAAPARPAAAGNGVIYFASERTGDWEIFVMNPDGSGQTNLTQSATKDERPGASPDGTKIAFGRTVGGNTDIYVMNADGSGLKRLTTAPENDHAPQWSPDGRKIAFRSDRAGNAEIFVMNADGSNQTRLTDNPATDHGPDWSPDGQRIIFSSDRDGNDNIFVMNADGSNVSRLTNNPADDFGASWSPDGGRVVFRSDRNGEPEVYIMDIDGSDQTNLTNNPAADRGPAWSPDGSKVIFYSDRDDGDYEIYVMNLDGSNQTRLTRAPGRDFQPDWASDGGVVDPPCYALSRGHSGSGADPTANPTKSPGCGAGQYIAGALITLTAAPAAGWHVAGWSGTANDSSTATTNSVTMPAAAHTAGVIYQEAPVLCYTLSRTHSGSGNNPVASPTSSTGCGAGQYVAGQVINLTAAPAAGWHVAGWSGTANDSSTATTNSVTMPAAAHTAGVTYAEIPVTCFRLTRTHSGNGNDPTAAPAASSGCDTGEYKAGEEITLTADPAADHHVIGWDGTNNDNSTAATNTVTMPAADHTVSVSYDPILTECPYLLTLGHSGQGADPVAEPAHSPGCNAGRYVAGQAIALTAAPADGWEVAGWDGANDDAATTPVNSLIMPAANHLVNVRYEPSPPREEWLFLPVVLRPAADQ